MTPAKIQGQRKVILAPNGISARSSAVAKSRIAPWCPRVSSILRRSLQGASPTHERSETALCAARAPPRRPVGSPPATPPSEASSGRDRVHRTSTAPCFSSGPVSAASKPPAYDAPRRVAVSVSPRPKHQTHFIGAARVPDSPRWRGEWRTRPAWRWTRRVAPRGRRGGVGAAAPRRRGRAGTPGRSRRRSREPNAAGGTGGRYQSRRPAGKLVAA